MKEEDLSVFIQGILKSNKYR